MKIASYIFQGMLEKLLLWKFWKIIRKTSLVAFFLKKFELSNLPTFNYSENWLRRKCFLSMLLEFSKLLWERLWCNQFLIIWKLLCFATPSRNLTRAWYVPIVTLLEISRSPLLIGFAGLQYIVCNAVKGVLKLAENFQEVVSNMVPYQKYTDIQAAAFSLACF